MAHTALAVTLQDLQTRQAGEVCKHLEHPRYVTICTHLKPHIQDVILLTITRPAQLRFRRCRVKFSFTFVLHHSL